MGQCMRMRSMTRHKMCATSLDEGRLPGRISDIVAEKRRFDHQSDEDGSEHKRHPHVAASQDNALEVAVPVPNRSRLAPARLPSPGPVARIVQGLSDHRTEFQEAITHLRTELTHVKARPAARPICLKTWVVALGRIHTAHLQKCSFANEQSDRLPHVGGNDGLQARILLHQQIDNVLHGAAAVAQLPYHGRSIDGVVDLDTEVAMSEQELHRSQIGCPAI